VLTNLCWTVGGFAIKHPQGCWHLGVACLGRWSRMAFVAVPRLPAQMLCCVNNFSCLWVNPRKGARRGRTLWSLETSCWRSHAQRVWVHALAWGLLGDPLDKQLQLCIFLFWNPILPCYRPVWKIVPVLLQHLMMLWWFVRGCLVSALKLVGLYYLLSIYMNF